MSASSASAPPAEWYLAREGQQFGPLSEAELNKLVEFGHVRPDDLLWYEGLADWKPAETVLPAFAARAEPPASPHPPPQAPPPVHSQPVQPPQPSFHAEPPRPGYPSAGHQGPYRDPVPGYPQPAPRPEPKIDPGALHHIPQATPIGPAPGQPHAHAPRPHHHPHTAQHPRPGPNTRPHTQRRDEGWQEPLDGDEEETRAGGGMRWLKRAAIAVFFLGTLSAAAYYVYPQRDRIMSAITSAGGGKTVAVVESASPVIGFAPTPQATDNALQKSQLWRVLKRDFPDWYAERIVEAAELASAQKGDAAIGLQMMQKVVQLRRQHAVDVLSAGGPHLKGVAAAFVANLARLRAEGVEACFGYISKGEVSTPYLEMLAKPEHAPLLQTQLVAVFEAVAEGRKLPKIYPQPRQGDYNLVVAALEQRGWGEADLQLFSDSQRLAKAAPAKVCQLVTDWFEAQISLKDDEAQMRLLVDALRPVVAG